jgi:hypothetical protein
MTSWCVPTTIVPPAVPTTFVTTTFGCAEQERSCRLVTLLMISPRSSDC